MEESCFERRLHKYKIGGIKWLGFSAEYNQYWYHLNVNTTKCQHITKFADITKITWHPKRKQLWRISGFYQHHSGIKYIGGKKM